MTVAEPFSSFDVYQERFKAAKAIYDRAGKPRSLDPLIVSAKQSLDTFFSTGDLAFYWGKLHYGDSSGGPGQRARAETGFAQKAAQTRVINNGNKFAENALTAAKAGRAALELVSLERHKATGPSLMEFFVNAIDQLRSQLLRQRNVKLSQVATTGSWCFSQAAILGMVVSRDPDEFLPMVWDPGKTDTFWEKVNAELDRIDSSGLIADTSLGYIRMRTEYSELYGTDVFAAAIADGNLKELERLADSQVSLADARMRWSMDTAMGLGLGILRPDFTRACLETQANPDRKSWTQAHQAGLDIPPEPDALSVDEQIEGVLEGLSGFLSGVLSASQGEA